MIRSPPTPQPQEHVVTVGPVSVAVIEFPGNKFTGEILPALRDLVAGGTIRIIDLIFVAKDADGTVVTLEIAGVDEALEPMFLELDIEHSTGLLGDDDVTLIAESLTPNNSAAMIAWENTWAIPFGVAVANADGRLIDMVHIPRDAVLESLEAAGLSA